MSGKIRCSIIATLLCLMTAPVFQAFAIDGSWHGKLSLGPGSLTIVFHFTQDAGGTVTCTMDSPDQGAKGLPAQVDFISADSVAVSMPALRATYKGKLRDDKLSGVFSQRGFNIPLVLEKGELALNRPQNPQPPFPYITENVTFTSKTDGAVLAGTLSYPEGRSKNDCKDIPVVLMVSGSGQQDRDESLMGHRPFAVIADYLARNGIASLRYDDRGMAASDKGTAALTVENNKEDAASGIAYLRSLGIFGQVGVLGHSEGGLIAFMIAGEKQCDFAISLAGPAVRGDSLMIEQNKLIMINAAGLSEGLAGKYADALGHILLAMKENSQIDVEKILSDCGHSDLPLSLKQNFKEVTKMQSTWMTSFLNYDPKTAISKITCPVLALNGEMDLQVPAKQNIPVLRDLLQTNQKTTIKTYPDLNHLFQHCDTGVPMEYSKIEETISTEVLHDIVSWITDI